MDPFRRRDYAGKVIRFARSYQVGGRMIPFAPLSPLPDADVLPESYLEGEFDGEGRLVRLVSFVRARTYFVQRIKWEKARMVEIILADAEGKVLFSWRV